MELPTPEIEVEYKATVDDEGNVVLKKKSEIRKGQKSKSSGGQFEARVRKDLEEKGWTVSKWVNNVDIESGKIVPSKRLFNPITKFMAIGTGYPDFIAFQRLEEGRYRVIGVEVKINGKLSREEKEKSKWYLSNGTFADILVARKKKERNRVFVEYTNFKEIEERMR